MAKDSLVDKTENGYTDLHERDSVQLLPKSAPSALAVKSAYLRECLAEFIGTAILIAFGDGVVAQVVLGKGGNGDYTHISICWGIAVFFGIHFAGGVSGAHLNPAVTTTLALFNRFEWRKVPGYVLAQILGAFFGAFIVYIVYYPYFNHVDPDRMTTQGVFATYPSAIVSNYTAFLTEVIGTAILLGGIFAVGDQKNKPASTYTSPAAVAILVIGIGMAFGMNSGYAINPARDFGPRLFSSIAGWGSKVFTLRDYYFWIPIVGPLIGGAIGGAAYMLFVEIHHPQDRRARLALQSISAPLDRFPLVWLASDDLAHHSQKIAVSSLPLRGWLRVMHMIKKARAKVSSAPPVYPTDSPKSSSPPPPKAKERGRGGASVMASLFTSKVKPPPPPPQPQPSTRSLTESSSPVKRKTQFQTEVASAELSPEKEKSPGENGSSSKRFESEFARGLRKELSKRLAEPVVAAGGDAELVSDEEDEDDEDDDDRGELLDDDDGGMSTFATKQLEQQLQALTSSSAESEEAWRRENTRLRKQLAAATKHEVAQAQQLQSYERQLARSKQEIELLSKNLMAATASQSSTSHRTPPAVRSEDGKEVVSSIRERELLRLVIELVGKDSVKSLLKEYTHASPADLRQALAQRHLLQQQQQHKLQSRQAPPSPFSFQSASEASNSPLRDTAASTSTKQHLHHQQQQQQCQVLDTDRSSPALDAIYAKFWKDDL